MSPLIQNTHKLILASSSPRRSEILKLLGFEFTIKPSQVKENYPKDLQLEAVPLYLAELKASSINLPSQNSIIIGADTVVILENKILGKPKNKTEANQMLHQISGKTHKVITGVCLMYQNQKITFAEETLVTFKKLSNYEIEFYVNNFESLDKAGGYACQEWIGMIGISRINGDYYNVVGLPICRLYQELQNF